MTAPRRRMFCRKRFCKFGGGQTILMNHAGEHLPGWLPSPAAAPSIGCGLTDHARGSPPKQQQRTGTQLATQPKKLCARKNLPSCAERLLNCRKNSGARCYWLTLKG